MRLAWFTPAAADTAAPTDDLGLLIRALAPRYRIEAIDERAAHDFVWRQARDPYDLCVYELDNTAAHQYVWAYALHYPGVTLMRSLALPRLLAGVRGPRTSYPLYASRLVVVAQASTADVLQSDYPGARIRAITPGVEPLSGPADEIVESLRWPVDGAPLTDALAGFAAGRPVIVFDCTETADWPSIDPHDWQSRTPEAPICVAIDPRDEAHSRRVAVRRLREDRELRARLGAAARVWWETHATVPRAAAAFAQVLEDARTLPPPAKPADWPAAIGDDGMRLARGLVAPLGISDLRLGG
jgi:hypothetical protein